MGLRVDFPTRGDGRVVRRFVRLERVACCGTQYICLVMGLESGP
jgi:hypothetical protein